ncbi:MAG: hypothetical protein J6P09_05530 [Methanobrevibacter sp.]|nr:hypothetical protein [Methanobrevibacter sp.]
MKLNKIIILISMLIMLCLASNSYAENVTYSNESTNITFEGVDFTIPEGFGQLKDNEDFNDLGSDGKTCFYINEAKGEIQITVISDWMGMSLEELYKDGATKTKINGHSGWNYTENDLHYFGYVHNDTGILVGVTNETRLFEVIL